MADTGLRPRTRPASRPLLVREPPRRPPLPKPGRRPGPAKRRAVKAAAKTEPGFLLLLAVIGLLTLIGLVMVLAASSESAIRQGASPWSSFVKQSIWAAFGMAAIAVALKIDHHKWRPLALPALLLVVGMLVVVMVPGIGLSVNGSRRWLGVAFWQFQPSEIAKLVFIVFAADLLARRADRMHDTRVTFRPVALVAVVMAALVIEQPDMGTAIIICSIAGAMLFVAGTPPKTLAKGFAALVSVAAMIGVVAPYRMQRLLSFLHPQKDTLNTGYQAVQGRIGMATGGWFGVGLGAGRVSTGYLPNANTDFIFAVIGEELGFVGCVLVIILFATVAVIGARTAALASDRYGSLIATGVTAWIVIQTLVNVGAVIGLLPVTGVPLPFVSFGGSSMLITMAAVGLLASVARRG